MDTSTRTLAQRDAHLGRYHPEHHPPGYRAEWLAERDRIGAHADDTAAIVVGSIMVRVGKTAAA